MFVCQPTKILENLKAPPHHDFFFLLSIVSYPNKLHFRSQTFFHILHEKRLTQCQTDNKHMINESRYYHQDRQHSTAVKNTWFGVYTVWVPIYTYRLHDFTEVTQSLSVSSSVKMEIQIPTA